MMNQKRFHSVPNPQSPLYVRQDWLVSVSLAIWSASKPDVLEQPGVENPRTQKLRDFLTDLDENPKVKARVGALICSVLQDCSGFTLFSATGLPSESGFFSDFVDRVAKKIIPRPPDETNLAEFFIRLFHGMDDATWIASLPDDVFLAIANLIDSGQTKHQNVWKHLAESMCDALLYLGYSVGYFGMTEEIRSRTESRPFLSLGAKLVEMVNTISKDDESASKVKHLVFNESMACLSEARQALISLQPRLEESGVSVNLVYKLEKLSANLDRIGVLLETVVKLDQKNQPAFRVDLARRLCVILVQGCFLDSSVRALVHTNLKLISRKIVERTGEVGEHYITRSRSQFFKVLWQAGGGGVLTVGTTLSKFAISSAKFPYFFEFFFSSINYAVSFVVMHFLGFKLATKQPAMFASALAGKLRATRTEFEKKEFVDEVARVVRSQTAALVGNLGFVIPATLLIDFLYHLSKGKHVLDSHKAESVLLSLHPLQSVTIPAAALTGIILFLASVFSGWLDNWMVYRNVPEGIASSRRFHSILGPKLSRRLGMSIYHHAAGVGGSVMLGILLAVTPVIGKIFGIDILDIRHVTLSTSSLSLAISTLGSQAWHSPQTYFAIFGIALIALLNFGVSFVFALVTALRARDVSASRFKTLVFAVNQRIWKKPLEFLWPPREK